MLSLVFWLELGALFILSITVFLAYTYYRRLQFFKVVQANKKNNAQLVTGNFNLGLGHFWDFIQAIAEHRGYNIIGEYLRPYWDMSSKTEFNEIFADTLFLRNTVVIFDPISVKHLFVTKAMKFSKGDSYSALKLALGEGLLTSDGQIWKKQRNLLNTVFTTSNIRKMNTDMKLLTLQFIKEVQTGITEITVVHFEKKMSELTLRIVTAAVFGDELSFASKMAELWSRVVEQVLPFMLKESMLPFYRYLPMPSTLKLKSDVQEITTLTDSIIQIHLEKIKKEHCLDCNGLYQNKDGKCYLLPLLLTIKDSEGNHIPKQQVIDESLTFLFAGHDTV